MSQFEKRRVVTSIVMVAVVLQAGFAGAAFFLRRDAEQDLVALRTRCDDLDARVEMAVSSSKDAHIVVDAGWRLAESSDVSGTLQIIQSLGDAAQVDLTGIKTAKSTTDGKQTFQITGVGSPEAFCAFAAGIERHEHLIVLETGRVLPGTENTVVFDLGLATYHGKRPELGQ